MDFPPIAAQSVCTEVAALILGPTGLAYDPEDDVLFVASRADNTIFAVPQCAKRKPADRQWRRGQRRSDPAEEIVEFTTTGRFVRQFNVDAAEGGAFGIGLASLSKLVRFAFVDDNAVNLTVTDRKSPDLPDD